MKTKKDFSPDIPGEEDTVAGWLARPSVYGMSEVLGCSRAIAADKLGYDPTPRKGDDEDRLRYYTRLEAVAASQISDLGYEVIDYGLCDKCFAKGVERYGMHVEIDTPLFLLVGHVDRQVIINRTAYPVEIKSLGKDSWSRFNANQFEDFPEYAGQECCYLESQGIPGIYWVMNRDTGKPDKYIVDKKQSEHSLKIPGFKNINLPISFDQILDKLNNIELHVREEKLPDGDTENCWFCRYKYLCIKDKPTIPKVENEEYLLQAAEQYKEGHLLEKKGKEEKSKAVGILLNHAKNNNLSKYQVEDVSFTYRGFKEGMSFDSKKFKAQHPKLYQSYLVPREGSEDYSIKVLKKED